MTSKKVSTARKKSIARVVNQIMVLLKPFGVYVYHQAKTGSTYLKFLEPGMGSIRVGDHEGREKYHYRYNVRLDHLGAPMRTTTAGWVQYFFGARHLDLLRDAVALRHHQRLADQGPPPNFDTTVPLWGEPRKEAVDGQ